MANARLRLTAQWTSRTPGIFSGLSGGPLYVVEGQEEHEIEDEELFPVGIVFEGYPSSGRFDVGEARDATIAFLTSQGLRP